MGVNWVAVATSLAGLAAAVAFHVLRPKGEDPRLRRCLQDHLTRAPWDQRRAFLVGLWTAGLAPWRGHQDRTAVGTASAGATNARPAMAFAASGRIALPAALLLAALSTRSTGFCLLGLGAVLVAGVLVRTARRPRVRSFARLGCAWALAGLGPVGLARLGELGTVVLAPWAPVVDAAAYVAIGIGLRTFGVSLPYFLLPAAGLAGAGWLGTQAALGLLAGGHLGAALALARIGGQERGEARVVAFGASTTRAAQGLLVFIGTLATLPLLAHSTGSPIAVTLALFLWEVCTWAAVTGAAHAAGGSLDEALRIRLPEGRGTGVPSLRATPLVVAGIGSRSGRLGELAESLARPRTEPPSAFKLEQWREESGRLTAELDALRERVSGRALSPAEEHALAGSLRSAAGSRHRLDSWIASYARGVQVPSGGGLSPGAPPSLWRRGAPSVRRSRG